MILFENCFDIIWSESLLRVCMREEGNTNNLQIRFGFGKMRFIYLKKIDVVQTLDIIVDDRHIGLLRYFVGNYSNSYRVRVDVIS